MDPFADKVLVIGAFVMLGGPAFVHDRIRWPTSNLGGITGEALPGPEVVRQVVSHVLPWMVVVILARELLVTSIRGVFEARGVSFAATASGKWKMILQSVCIPLVLVLVNLPRLNDPVKKDWAWWTIEMVVWATVVVTVWSGWPYVARAVREREKLKDRAA
jgi:CDP-diacylglycerol--glycerol-3-phosphate 3-phosphatidyltransferase